MDAELQTIAAYIYSLTHGKSVDPPWVGGSSRAFNHVIKVKLENNQKVQTSARPPSRTLSTVIVRADEITSAGLPNLVKILNHSRAVTYNWKILV